MKHSHNTNFSPSNVSVLPCDNKRKKFGIVIHGVAGSCQRSLADFKALEDTLRKLYSDSVPQLILSTHTHKVDAATLTAHMYASAFDSFTANSLQNWLRAALAHTTLANCTEMRSFLSVIDTNDDDDEDDDDDDDDDEDEDGYEDLNIHLQSLGFDSGDDFINESLDIALHNDIEERSKNVSMKDFAAVRVLGKGSFGKVMLVRHRESSKLYALKIIDKAFILRRKQIEHTQTERNILEYIRHPFVVTMRFAFQTDQKLFLVLDFCAGGELFFHLSRNGKFSEKRAKFYAAQITLALEYLHDLGIVYRDLKPENVLLDAEGNIALTDFGLSKEGINDNFSAHSFCGTPEYLAPEVLRRTGHGRAADWWSLGTLLYEMLTGLPPFHSRDENILFKKILTSRLTMPHDLSPEASSLLIGLLNRRTEERLGAQRDAHEIKDHPFFSDIDWTAMLTKQLSTPFVPSSTNDDNTSNFDEEFTTLPLLSLGDTNNTATKIDETLPNLNNAFKDFSYVSNSFKQSK